MSEADERFDFFLRPRVNVDRVLEGEPLSESRLPNGARYTVYRSRPAWGCESERPPAFREIDRKRKGVLR